MIEKMFKFESNKALRKIYKLYDMAKVDTDSIHNWELHNKINNKSFVDKVKDGDPEVIESIKKFEEYKTDNTLKTDNMTIEKLNLDEDTLDEIREEEIVEDVENFLKTAHFRIIEKPQLTNSCFEDEDYIILFKSDEFPEDDYSMRSIAESPLFPKGLMDEMECCYTYAGNLSKTELIEELQNKFGFTYKNDVVNFLDIY
jgi:hypothetical protein